MNNSLCSTSLIIKYSMGLALKPFMAAATQLCVAAWFPFTSPVNLMLALSLVWMPLPPHGTAWARWVPAAAAAK